MKRKKNYSSAATANGFLRPKMLFDLGLLRPFLSASFVDFKFAPGGGTVLSLLIYLSL